MGIQLIGRKVRPVSGERCRVSGCKRPQWREGVCESHHGQLSELVAATPTRWTVDDLRYPNRDA